MSLKKYFPPTRFNGEKVDPDEMNFAYEYMVMYPTIGSSFVGTAAANLSGSTSAFVLASQQLDYPRNLLLTIVNTAGSLNAGTVTVTGTDQFGGAQTETIGVALGTATTAVAGSKIFNTVSTASITFGTGQVQNGTPYLGVAIGTAAGQVAAFGLPVRIGGTSDVKSVTWINNGTSTAITGGTVVGSLVSTANHSFAGTHIVAATDIYVVTVLSSFNSENTPVNK